MMKRLTHFLHWRLLALLGLDSLFFSWTNVTTIPAYMVGVGFLLLCATMYYGVYAVISISRFYGIKVRRKALTLHLTLVISGLIALQSVGQLSQRDIVVLLPLALIGYIYGAYAKAIRRNLES
jgi:hypothetical protein